jgi:UDP:flavonoid glycosyltransferase YjiC (YdhE family)
VRVLIVALPGHGHLHPVIPLAIALRDTGHEVTVATGTNSEGTDLVDIVASAGLAGIGGLTSIGAGRDFVARTDPSLMRLPPEQRAPMSALMFARFLAERTFARLTEVLAWLPVDLVVYEEMALGGLLAARAAGVPAVSQTVGGRGWIGAYEEAMRPALRAAWHAVAGPAAQAPPLHPYGDLLLDICPPSLQPPGVAPATPLRPVNWNPPASAIPAPVRRGRPLVYFSLGTVRYPNGGDVFRNVLDGLLRLDIDIVASLGTAGDPAMPGMDDPRVRYGRFIDQAALLAHADIVVSHGGSGTFLGGFENGAPQLVVPVGAPDQTRNGMAAAACGAGRVLRPAQATPEAVAEAVAALLDDDSYRAAAAKLRAEIAAMPEPDSVVPIIEKLAGAG